MGDLREIAAQEPAVRMIFLSVHADGAYPAPIHPY